MTAVEPTERIGEQPIASYRQSILLGILLILGGAAGLTPSDSTPIWVSWFSLAVSLWGGIDLLWSAWHRPVTLYPSRIVMRLAFPGRAVEVRFGEVVGWEHGSMLLGFEVAAFELSYYFLGRIRRSDRRRLIAQLSSRLGDPGGSARLSADLERREGQTRRLTRGLIAFGVLVLIGVLASVWLELHRSIP